MGLVISMGMSCQLHSRRCDSFITGDYRSHLNLWNRQIHKVWLWIGWVVNPFLISDQWSSSRAHGKFDNNVLFAPKTMGLKTEPYCLPISIVVREILNPSFWNRSNSRGWWFECDGAWKSISNAIQATVACNKHSVKEPLEPRVALKITGWSQNDNYSLTTKIKVWADRISNKRKIKALCNKRIDPANFNWSNWI